MVLEKYEEDFFTCVNAKLCLRKLIRRGVITDTVKGDIESANNDEAREILFDIVEAHCYFVDIGRTDREQIRSRINNNDCRTFRPRRPLSTAYRTVRSVRS